jgi:hypothetical protein
MGSITGKMYLLNSHSRLSKGQTCRVFNHLDMQ